VDYLLDTSTFSDLVRENQQVAARLKALTTTGSTVLICAITRGEVLFGVERMPTGKRREEIANKTAQFLAGFPCVAVNETAADHYARIKVLRQQSGVALAENDLWIAATALALGATLVARDSDLDNVPGLVTEHWTT
jgi:tRNA(fMet)-specific endonuclease VapC